MEQPTGKTTLQILRAILEDEVIRRMGDPRRVGRVPSRVRCAGAASQAT